MATSLEIERPIEKSWRHSLEAHSDLLMLLAGFAAFRLLAVIFFRPGGLVYVAGDFPFYWDLAELSLDGQYPYLNYWLEYPPIFPLAFTLLYRLSLLLPAWPNPMMWFQVLLSSFLAVFDVGNVLLVYGIARSLHGHNGGLRAALTYAGLFIPLYALTNWFDTLPLFFLLLSIYATIRRWPVWTGLALGVGFMTKLFPAVVGPVALLSGRGWRERLAFIGAGAAAVLAIAMPLLLANRDMFLASFQSMISRSSWLTPWALLEGYFGVGYMPNVAARFVPEYANWQVHEQTLPWLLMYGALALSYLVLFTRKLDWREPRVMVAATALAFNLLLLFSKGYSPQFMIYVLALLVVVFPTPWGLAYALLLTFNSFVEWPIAGVFFGDQQWLLWTVVLVRTALLVVLCVEYASVLLPRWRPRWQSVRLWGVAPVMLALLVGAAVSVPALAAQYATDGDQYDVVTRIQSLSVPGQTIVASSREMFYAINPRFPEDRLLSPRPDLWQNEEVLKENLAEFTAGTSQTWLILDHTTGDQARRDLLLGWFDKWGSRATDTWFGPYRLLCYVPQDQVDMASLKQLNVEFGGQLELVGWEARSLEVGAGETARISLVWRATSQPQADYKVFIHLLDADGRIVAQHDRSLDKGGLPSSQWQPGGIVREAYDLEVPAGAQPGPYVLAAGLYEPQSGKRLIITDGAPAGGDHVELEGMLVR